jgi:hypothetical protein
MALPFTRRLPYHSALAAMKGAPIASARVSVSRVRAGPYARDGARIRWLASASVFRRRVQNGTPSRACTPDGMAVTVMDLSDVVSEPSGRW